MITIVNRKTWRGESVYVGRPSVLGNPFVIGKGGNREAVIHKYRRWLWTELRRESGPVVEEIHRLATLAKSGDLVLACWCFPQQCHAAVVKAAIEWINLQPQEKERSDVGQSE